MPAAFKTALGNAAATASGTTCVITTTAAIAVGDLVVVRWAADNLNASTPTGTVTDSGGNTYTAHAFRGNNATAATGVVGGIAATKATAAVASGGTITLTLSGSVVQKAMYAESFTGVDNTLRVAAVVASGATTTPSVTSGSAANGDLVIGCVAIESRTAPSAYDSDTSNGSWSTAVLKQSATTGTDATLVEVVGQYKIVTATATQIYNLTIASTDWAAMICAFVATVVPSNVPVRTFDGVDDRIEFNPSSLVGMTYGTIVGMIKINATQTTFVSNSWFGLYTSGNAEVMSAKVYYTAASTAYLSLMIDGTEMYVSWPNPTTTTWRLVVIAKATGTVAPKMWVYDFSTFTWLVDNVTATGTKANSANTVAKEFIGWEAQDNQYFKGDNAAVAAWKNVALTDTQVKTLINNYAAWFATSPTQVKVLNQASIATVVPDQLDAGSTQTAIVGTAVTTSSPFADTPVAPPAYISSGAVYVDGVTTSPTLSLTHAAGDLLLAVAQQYPGTSTTPTPTGWTLVDGPLDSSNPTRSWCWKRIADGTATDNLTLTFSQSSSGGVVGVAIRGQSAVQPIDVVAAPVADHAQSSTSTRALTSLSPGSLDVHIGILSNNSTWYAHTPTGAEVERLNAAAQWAGVMVSTEQHPTSGSVRAAIPYTHDTSVDAHLRSFVIRSAAAPAPAVPSTWSDNFNRPDEGLAVGPYAIWSQYSSGNGLQIVSNAVQPSVDFQIAFAARTDVATPAVTQFVKVTNVDMNKNIILGLFQTNPVVYRDGIWIEIYEYGQVFWYVNGAFNGNPNTSQPNTGSHVCELRYDGTTARFLVDGVEYSTLTTTITSAGGRTFQGFGSNGAMATIDNASGGDSTASAGGAVALVGSSAGSSTAAATLTATPAGLSYVTKYSAVAIASGGGANNDTTVNCGTVATGSLLTVLVGTTANQGGAPFTTPSKASGTATIGTVTSIGVANSSNGDKAAAQAWQCVVTVGGTLVLNIQDAVLTYGFGVTVLEWTGQDTSTPVAGAVTALSETAGNFSPTTATLTATPVAGDYTVAVANWDTDAGTKAVTAGSGFTAIGSVVGTGGDFVEMLSQQRTGSTSTTVTWPTQGGPTTYSKGGVAFIVKAVPAVVTPFVVAATNTGVGPSTTGVSKPAGGTTGDYYVIYYSSETVRTVTFTGFTAAPGGMVGATGQNGQYFWKAYDGSEGSTFSNVGGNGGEWTGYLCFLVRGLPAGWTPYIPAPVTVIGSTAVVLPAVNSLPANTLMLVSYKDYNGTGWSVPGTFVPATTTASPQGYSQKFDSGGTAGPFTITPSPPSNSFNMAQQLFSAAPPGGGAAVPLAGSSAGVATTTGTLTTSAAGPTSFTDDFNRAGPALGSNWELVPGLAAALTISGNAVVSSAGVETASRVVGMTNPVQLVAGTFKLGADYSEAGVISHATAGGTAMLAVYTTDGTHPSFPGFGDVDGPAYQLYYLSSGVGHMLANTAAVNATAPRRVAIAVNGNAMQGWFDGILRLTATDGGVTPRTSSPGVTTFNDVSGTSGDDFSAQTFTSAPAAPTITALMPSSAAIGATVTVTGTGFYADFTEIAIGGVHVPVTVTSPTTGTFVVPITLGGLGTAVVTTPFGTDSDPFTVVTTGPYLGNTTEAVGATSATVAKPSGYTGAANQQLFLCVFSASSTPPDIPVVPAGFTMVGSPAISSILSIYGLTCYTTWFRSTTDVSGASNYAVTASGGSVTVRVICGVINNASGPGTPAYDAGSGGTSMSLPPLTTTVANSLVLAFGTADDPNTMTVPDGYVAATVEGTNYSYFETWQTLKATVGALDRPFTIINGSSSAIFVSTLAYAPAAVGGPVALAGSSAGVSTASGALARGVPLASTSIGVATDTGTLVVARALVGSSAGLSTAAATTVVRALALAGSSAGTSTASGDVTRTSATGIFGSSVGTSTASGSLTVALALAATVPGTSTASGTQLALARPLGTASAAGTSTASGTLTTNSGLGVSAASAGTSTATGSLSVNSAVAGTSIGLATTTGSLAVARPLAGAAAGASTSSGDLTVSHTLVSSSAGVSTASGTLIVAHTLVGSSAGVSTASAVMVVSGAGGMAAVSMGTSTASGSLSVMHTLAGRSDGTSTASGALAKAIPLAGSSAGLSTASAVGLSRIVPLAGSSAGSSTATATALPVTIALTGSADGLSTVVAGLVVARALVALSSGVSTATGTLRVARSLSGSSAGKGTAQGTLQVIFIAPVYGIWNGMVFDAMQYGDKQVTAFIMSPT